MGHLHNPPMQFEIDRGRAKVDCSEVLVDFSNCERQEEVLWGSLATPQMKMWQRTGGGSMSRQWELSPSRAEERLETAGLFQVSLSLLRSLGLVRRGGALVCHGLWKAEEDLPHWVCWRTRAQDVQVTPMVPTLCIRRLALGCRGLWRGWERLFTWRLSAVSRE